MSMIFKGTLTIYFLIALAAIGLAAAALSPLTAEAEAQGYEADLDSTSVEPAVLNPVTTPDPMTVVRTGVSGDFVYQAEMGDNLTYFARRSIQLYLEPAIHLNTAQVIAAETYIVRDLGGFSISVGQEVKIPVTLVIQGLQQALLLDEADLMRWSVYAPIRQSLEHIMPIMTPSYVSEAAIEPEVLVEPEVISSTVEITTVETVEITQTTDEVQTVTTPTSNIEQSVETFDYDDLGAENATAKRDSSFYLTLIGALVLIGVVVWVLVLSFFRDTKAEEDFAQAEDSVKLRDKIAGSKLTQKIKGLPKTVSRKEKPVKKAKTVKPKKTRNRKNK